MEGISNLGKFTIHRHLEDWFIGLTHHQHFTTHLIAADSFNVSRINTHHTDSGADT